MEEVTEKKQSHYQLYKETIKACRKRNYYNNPEVAEKIKAKKELIIQEYLKSLIKN